MNKIEMFSYLLELNCRLHAAEKEYGMKHRYTELVRSEYVGAYHMIQFSGLYDEFHEYLMLHKYGIDIRKKDAE